MCLRDKLCQKKTFILCSFFLSVLLCLSYSVSTFAQGVWIARFGARVNTSTNCATSSYVDNYLYNQTFYGCNLTGIQVYSQNVQSSGNSVVWNGKLNIVKRVVLGVDGQYTNRFKGEQNFNFTGLKFGNVDINVINQQKNYWRTTWSDGTYDYQTLTIAWTISGTAAQDIVNQTAVMTMSIFPNDGSSFDYRLPGTQESSYYFENTNEAMEILFTPNGLEGINALINENQKLQIQNQTIINQNQSMISNQNRQIDAINSQTEQQHADYENEVDREEDKQDELEDQSGDLSLSANLLDHPFIRMFDTSQYACYTTQRIHQFFNSSAWTICSPFPSAYQWIISSVGSMFIIAILLRLYYKKLKGGVDG